MNICTYRVFSVGGVPNLATFTGIAPRTSIRRPVGTMVCCV